MNELTKYEKQRIRDLHNKWYTRFKIVKKLNLSSILVDKVLYKYITWKKYNWNKICSKCREPKPYTEEYFQPNWYITKQWLKVLRSDCRICRNKFRKKQRADWLLWLEQSKSTIQKRVKRILKVYNHRFNKSLEERQAINKKNAKQILLRRKEKRLQKIIDLANKKRNNI